MGDEISRRTYLNSLVATSITASIAGCNSSQDNSNLDSTTRTPTATPNQAPQILAHNGTPQDNGTKLAVQLEGEDDQGLSLARIEYGGEAVEKTPDTPSVEIDDEFTDLGEIDLDATPGQVTFLLRDSTDREARAEVYPDETAPALQTFDVELTENAGEVAVRIDGRDDTGLKHAAVLLGEQVPLRENVAGQTEYNTDQRVTLPEDTRFKQSTVTASLADWNGNTTETEAETYIRKYDLMEETRLEIGAVYIPWAGDKFGKCIDQAEPAIGQYDDPISPGTTSKHIDQMQGHGITNVLFNFNGTQGDRRSTREFVKSDLSSKVGLRPFYTVKDYRWNPDDDSQDWKAEILPQDLGFLREHILSHENAFTHEGRPVLNIWNAAYIPWNDSYHTQIMEEWGSYAEFTADIRDHLRVDGKEPFIIGGVTGGGADDEFEQSKPQIPRFLKELDGTTSWTASTVWEDDNQATWEEVMQYVEKNYEGHRGFVDQHDMEFIPMVFPGFDDRMNTCWGQDRLTPRSQEHFAEVLQLADKYRTTDMVDIATWNDWTEGTQIEPGSFRDNDYETEYLKIIQEFQKPA